MGTFRESLRDEESVYFVAEAGVNHNGDVEMAERLVDVAAESGADAVKFQTFDADRLVTSNAPKTEYQRETTGERTQREMLKDYELTRSEHEHLQAYAEDRNVSFLSTPFDRQSADVLNDLDVPVFKIGSGELDNEPFLEYVAEFGKPMIVSTGMGTMDEVRNAFDTIRSTSPGLTVVLLHCTSAYPTAMGDTNLRAMRSMADELPTPVGHSDHTTAPETPAFAVAAGASVVEKHFTLSKRLPGPDHRASLEPDELERSVYLARAAITVLGSPEKRPIDAEIENRSIVRKSIHASERIEEGDMLTKENVDVKRPADGLSPAHFETILGTRVKETLNPGQAVTAKSVDTEIDE